MARLKARVARLAARRDPRPDGRFLAYARAVIRFGGTEPTPRQVAALATWLQGAGWRR